jgi:hypothetical protein
VKNVVFRVPRIMAEQTIREAVKNNIFDFRLEYSD